MTRGRKLQQVLSPNEALVVKALRQAGRPLGAYDLIKLLHGEGVSSPPTVYRALKRLTDAGLAHRIELLNAYVLCAHGDHRGHIGRAAFALCRDCGTVEEFHHDAAVELLDQWAAGRDFRIEKTTIELRGQCRRCAASATPAKA